MAKESMKAREVKRAKMVAKYAEKRKQMLEAGDYEGLQTLPKNACYVRLHNWLPVTIPSSIVIIALKSAYFT